MSAFHPFIRLAPVVSLLLGLSSVALAVDGFPIRVTKEGATIQIGSRIVGKVQSNTLLWATEFSKDNKWVSVKVPSVDRRGWMSVNDAANLKIPDEHQEDWKQAIDYGTRWTEQIEAGNLEKAANTAEEAAADMERILTAAVGPLTVGYPPIGVALNQAGVARMRMGQLQEAQALYERAVDVATTALGSQHQSTCISRANLAEVYVLREEWSKGIDAFDTSIPALEELSPAGVHMESYYVRYGTALAKQHRVFDGRLMFEKAIALAESKYGKFAPSVATIASLYATILDSAGGRQLAVQQLQRARLVYRNHIDKYSPLMIDVLNRLSAISARAGEFAASVEYATEAVETHNELDTADPLRLGSALNNLGFAQAKLGAFDDAAQSLNEAIRLIEESTDEAAVVRSFPVKNQGILAMEQGHLSEARALFKKALDVRQAAPGNNEIIIADAHALLGEVALHEDRKNEAAEHLFTAVKSQASQIGIDHPDCRRNIMLLQQAIEDDHAGNEKLDRLIVESRERQRLLALGTSSESTQTHDSIGTDYRLANILAGKPATAPETKYFALEVTSDMQPCDQRGKRLPTSNVEERYTAYELKDGKDSSRFPIRIQSAG